MYRYLITTSEDQLAQIYDDIIANKVSKRSTINYVINNSENLFIWLIAENEYNLKIVEAEKSPRMKLKEENTFFTWGADKMNPAYIKVYYKGYQIGIHCLDNVLIKEEYRNTLWKYSLNDLIKLHLWLMNALNFKYTLASAYFNRLKETSDRIAFSKDKKHVISDEFSSYLEKGATDRYGQFVTNIGYYTEDTIYSYDQNSAYLSAYYKLGTVSAVEKVTNELHEVTGIDEDYIYLINITKGSLNSTYQPWQQMLKDEKHSFKDFNEEIYKGIITQIELKNLLQSYRDLEYEILEAYLVYKSFNDDTKALVKKFYDEKNEYTGVEKMIVKTGALSAIGTFVNKSIFLKITHAFIIANAKEYIRDISHQIEEMGYKVVGTDTDAIKTNIPPEEFEKLVNLSGELGDFKIEHKFDDFFQYKPKQYIGMENGEISYVCGGQPEICVPELISKYKEVSIYYRKEVDIKDEEYQNLSEFDYHSVSDVIDLLTRWMRPTNKDTSCNDVHRLCDRYCECLC